MIALFGAPIVRCAKYAPAGTKELADLALEALDQSHAVLLSNYCAMTTGPTSAWSGMARESLSDTAAIAPPS